MKSKTPLILMEQVVMVLVFALAAALCLRVFAYSHQMSEKNKDLDNAVLLAQNTAELLKSCGGVEEAAAAAGGEVQQSVWKACYDAEGKPVSDRTVACYEVCVSPEPSGVEGLGRAKVQVFLCDGSAELFFITAAWQEVTGNG